MAPTAARCSALGLHMHASWPPPAARAPVYKQHRRFDDPQENHTTPAGTPCRFDDPVHTKPNSTENRIATVLMYLGQVQEGGETALPIAVPIDWKKQVGGNKLQLQTVAVSKSTGLMWLPAAAAAALGRKQNPPPH